MNTSASYETLLTVSLPEDLHSSLITYQSLHGFSSVSNVVRFALDNFNIAQLSPAPEAARQISFRIPNELRNQLKKQAQTKQVSLGHLIRAAISSLPEKPKLIPNKDTPMATKVKKAPAKKAPAKKAPAKKAPAKKAPAKKAPAKKAPAKKAVAKKAPAKKAPAKKAPAKKVAKKK